MSSFSVTTCVRTGTRRISHPSTRIVGDLPRGADAGSRVIVAGTAFSPGEGIRCTCSASGIPQHLPRGVVAAGAHDAAAGVGGGAAEVEAAEGGPVVGVTGDGAQEEELVEV